VVTCFHLYGLLEDNKQSINQSINKHCPARCTYAANMMGKALDILATAEVSLNHIL
jgi:hypothetical protein